MAIFVRVHRPGCTPAQCQVEPEGAHHGIKGEIVGGFEFDSKDTPYVLVALEHGALVLFHPSDLRRVGVNKNQYKGLE